MSFQYIGDEGGIDVDFYSKDKEELEKMRADFMSVFEEDLDGAKLCERYFPELAKETSDYDLSYALGFEVGEDIVDEEEGYGIVKDGDEWCFALDMHDTECMTPALFGAIAKKYYPSVRIMYTSYIYDDEKDDNRYCAFGGDFGKYRAVFCNPNPFRDVKDADKDEEDDCWVHAEEGGYNSLDEIEAYRKKIGYGKAFVSEIEYVDPCDAVLYAGKSVNELDLDNLQSEIKAHRDEDPTK